MALLNFSRRGYGIIIKRLVPTDVQSVSGQGGVAAAGGSLGDGHPALQAVVGRSRHYHSVDTTEKFVIISFSDNFKKGDRNGDNQCP